MECLDQTEGRDEDARRRRLIRKPKSQIPKSKNASAHFPPRVADLLLDRGLVDVPFVTLQRARPGGNRIRPASALREDIALMLLDGGIARHLLRGGRDVLLRLVIIAAAVIRP